MMGKTMMYLETFATKMVNLETKPQPTKQDKAGVKDKAEHFLCFFAEN